MKIETTTNTAKNQVVNQEPKMASAERLTCHHEVVETNVGRVRMPHGVDRFHLYTMNEAPASNAIFRELKGVNWRRLLTPRYQYDRMKQEN